MAYKESGFKSGTGGTFEYLLFVPYQLWNRPRINIKPYGV